MFPQIIPVHLPLSKTTPQTARGEPARAQEAELGTDFTPRIRNPIGNPHFPHAHAHPPLGDHVHDVDDAERGAAERAEDGHGRDGPQNELEVKVVRDVGAAVGLANGHGEDGVGDHPRNDHVGAHGAVVVLLLLSLRDAVGFDLEAVPQVAQGFVVAAVDIELLRGHLELDGVALAGDGGAEVDMDDVVTFGAPGDVVRVAEGVDLQSADVRREEGKILRR